MQHRNEKGQFTVPPIARATTENLIADMLTPDTSNCIVCDRQVDPNDGIVVFEFHGYGVEIFTFPKGRNSVWEKKALEQVQKGALPRWLGNGCHHGQGCGKALLNE